MGQTRVGWGGCSATPYPRGGVDDELELGPLLVLGEYVAAGDAGKAALGGEGELVEGEDAGGFLDAAHEVLLVLELSALGGDEAEDGGLAVGHEPQRLEIAGALAVVLQEEHVDGRLVEQLL